MPNRISLIVIAAAVCSVHMTKCALADSAANSASDGPTLAAPDDTVVLPENAKADAEKAFAAGYAYYVWPGEAGPIKRGDSNVLLVPFRYVANGAPVPYQTVLILVAAKQGSRDREEITQTVRPKGKTYSAKGSGVVIHLDFFKALSGKGTARIYLVDDATGTKQISNEFTVEVEL